MLLSTQFDSQIGPITLIRSNDGLCALFFGSTCPQTPSSREDDLLLQATGQVLEFLDGRRKSFTLPLDMSKLTEFQTSVLKTTLEIPYGEIRTYGEIAQILHKPAAARAVGGALSRNPMPILIPCHRVVGGNGHLTGYTGARGLETKQWLLLKEGVNIVSQKLD